MHISIRRIGSIIQSRHLRVFSCLVLVLHTDLQPMQTHDVDMGWHPLNWRKCNLRPTGISILVLNIFWESKCGCKGSNERDILKCLLLITSWVSDIIWGVHFVIYIYMSYYGEVNHNDYKTIFLVLHADWNAVWFRKFVSSLPSNHWKMSCLKFDEYYTDLHAQQINYYWCISWSLLCLLGWHSSSYFLSILIYKHNCVGCKLNGFRMRIFMSVMTIYKLTAAYGKYISFIKGIIRLYCVVCII